MYLCQVPVAVKTLRVGGGAASRRVRNYERERERFLAETELMKRLHHPHVVQLYGVCLEAAPFYLVQARSLKNVYRSFPEGYREIFLVPWVFAACFRFNCSTHPAIRASPYLSLSMSLFLYFLNSR
jgi:hypothetical protein